MFREVGTYVRKRTETDICINDHETRMDVPSALKMIASWLEVVSWGGGMISGCGGREFLTGLASWAVFGEVEVCSGSYF